VSSIQPAVADLAATGTVEGDHLLAAAAVDEVDGGGEVATEAVAGDGDVLARKQEGSLFSLAFHVSLSASCPKAKPKSLISSLFVASLSRAASSMNSVERKARTSSLGSALLRTTVPLKPVAVLVSCAGGRVARRYSFPDGR
jgi:hypothetical protein